jgi:acyl-CoA synthetase (AMP-forming)/AMP-acid ligase II
MHTTMLLEMAAEADGSRTALGAGADRTTYRELLQRSRAGAAGLVQRGAVRLAYLGPNSLQLPALLFAAGAAGVPFAPLNYRMADEQLLTALRQLSPCTLVVDPAMAPRAASVDAADGVDVISDDKLFAPADASTPEFVDPGSPAVLLMTSGTSGPPKAAILRHRHIVSYVISTVDFFAADEAEAILISTPPYHIAGVNSVLTSVYCGRRLVHLPEFSAPGWVDLAAAEGITHAMVVPTMLSRILDVLDKRRETLPSLRHLSYGGGRMPVPVVERALRLLPSVDFVNAYGLTETSSTISLLAPEDHRAALDSGDRAVRARLGSVGRPLSTVELEVRDLTGEALPAGRSGEIFVRGEQVSGEYLASPSSLASGWYATHDHGYLDAGGYLFLDGRTDDLIVRGGENISPGEIEDVLSQHPSVAEAAVLGIPDTEWSERVEAVVVAADGAEPDVAELQEWVRARLRSSRVPARIHVRSSLPATDTGKLLRRALRAELTRSTPTGSTGDGA